MLSGWQEWHQLIFLQGEDPMSMLIVRIFTSLGLLVFSGNDQEGNAFEIVEIDLATHAGSSSSKQSLRKFF